MRVGKGGPSHSCLCIEWAWPTQPEVGGAKQTTHLSPETAATQLLSRFSLTPSPSAQPSWLSREAWP